MENSVQTLHSILTSSIQPENSKDLIINFAKELGWSPSYFISPSKSENSNGYLVIEHGLQNSAIISFLNKRNEELTSVEEENLLALSYNNLVNWHITIDDRYINYYYILNKENRRVETKKIEVGNETEALNVNAFYEIIQRKPNSNLKALDDVLIDNISIWKRVISAELHNNIDLVSLSHFFNTIIFLRSIEDYKKRRNQLNFNSKIFIEILLTHQELNFLQIIEEIEKKLEIFIPKYVVNKEKLLKFEKITFYDLKRIFNSFYENDYNRFKYDFSIITKQALSRIYQKYVSLLSIEETEIKQETLFNFSDFPIEKINKESGAFYTPEYIARFFSKYILKKYTYTEIEKINVLDPAVGSGIFLRTLLETEIERRLDIDKDLNIDKLFNSVLGVDIDPNACLATNLSITLLNYNFNSHLTKPRIFNCDALKLMKSAAYRKYGVDLIISNPPYINDKKQNQEVSSFLKAILGDLSNGKIDAYHAFLKLSIDLLKPNGLALFVIPHNFLVSQSSKNLRNYILDNCFIECIADLSAINVFENVNTYTILLIVRKKEHIENKLQVTWLMKCRSSVGEALNQLLQENETDQNQFQVYKAINYFEKDKEWFILNKKEFELFNKIKENRKISDFLKLTQGVVTGKDDIFIRSNKDVTQKERKIYKNFLADKKINSYNFDKGESELIFFPFINNQTIDEQTLMSEFPTTWDYLSNNREVLQNRSKVRSSNGFSWWKLHSPGKPEDANSPKIISPYLTISPKFALDLTGEYVTSRSSYFTLKDKESDKDLLFYFLGILNSVPCYWALSLQSQKQSSGYNIFTINLLKTAFVPDPTLRENSTLVNQIILEVKNRYFERDYNKQIDSEKRINKIVCELYKLTNSEKELLGIHGD